MGILLIHATSFVQKPSIPDMHLRTKNAGIYSSISWKQKKGHFRFDSCYGCAHSPLVAAARQGEWDMIKNALLKCSEWVKGIINEWAEDGGTLLLLAADSKNTEMIQLLIEHGANPNADNQGFFLLSKAQHDSDFLIFLLELGE